MGMDSAERAIIGLICVAVVAAATVWARSNSLRYRTLLLATLVATLTLVVLGAFVRLSDAGLGCPDWPGCYGNLTPHHSAEQIRAAESARPGGPVSLSKAWKEMLHRYLAMIVGSLIAAIALSTWRNSDAAVKSPLLPAGLVLLVSFQALLGAWTVTMLLRPAIVTAHLLGGMALFALLAWQYLRQHYPSSVNGLPGIIGVEMRVLAAVGLIALIGQIALGGWVSTNYAALACPDFPGCQGEIIPEMAFKDAFHVLRPLGIGPDGQLLTNEALRAIHWTHRVGAIAVTAILLVLAVLLLRRPLPKHFGGILLVLLALQVVLGIGNVVGGLPLPIAVAHNAGAALLLGWLVYINFHLKY